MESHALDHSIWLMPSASDVASLRAGMSDVAIIGGTTRFEPHLTLLGDLTGAPSTTFDLCRKCWNFDGPIEGTIRALSSTASYFMSLFVDIVVPKEVHTARQLIGREVGVKDTPFRPHISLVYGLGQEALSDTDRAVLEKRFLGGKISLTAMAVVHSAKNVPLTAWRVLEAVSLTKPRETTSHDMTLQKGC